MSIFEEMADAVIRRSNEECVGLARRALEEGIEPIEAIQAGYAKGMEVVGNDFESGRIYLPEMMESAEAMNAAVEIFKPAMLAKGGGKATSVGKILLATIQGDMHDIGKNIVRLLMTGSGFEVIDLGKDVPVARIIEEAEAKQVDIIGLSALMTTTMGHMPALIQELDEMGIRKSFKVMVGGAPVTEDFATKIGCDGYAENAVGAVRIAKDLIDDQQP
jgi:corrinoid protein of di/trimethylamine methyltransferase